MMLPGYRGLDDFVKAGPQRDQRDYQLGCVAEGRVEQAADRRAGPMRQLLGRLADQAGERDYRQRGDDEEPQLGRVEQLEPDGDRDEQEQDIQPVARDRREDAYLRWVTAPRLLLGSGHARPSLFS